MTVLHFSRYDQSIFLVRRRAPLPSTEGELSASSGGRVTCSQSSSFHVLSPKSGGGTSSNRRGESRLPGLPKRK